MAGVIDVAINALESRLVELDEEAMKIVKEKYSGDERIAPCLKLMDMPLKEVRKMANTLLQTKYPNIHFKTSVPPERWPQNVPFRHPGRLSRKALFTIFMTLSQM